MILPRVDRQDLVSPHRRGLVGKTETNADTAIHAWSAYLQRPSRAHHGVASSQPHKQNKPITIQDRLGRWAYLHSSHPVTHRPRCPSPSAASSLSFFFPVFFSSCCTGSSQPNADTWIAPAQHNACPPDVALMYTPSRDTCPALSSQLNRYKITRQPSCSPQQQHSSLPIIAKILRRQLYIVPLTLSVSTLLVRASAF